MITILMSTKPTIFVWGLLVASACGDPEPAPIPGEHCKDEGGEACFQLPTAPMVNGDLEPSSVGCGAFETTDLPDALTIAGVVETFGGGDPVAAADLAIYEAVDFADPIVTGTSGDDGTYSLTVPAGSQSQLWTERGADGFLTAYYHAFRIDLSGDTDYSMFNLPMFTVDNIEGASVLAEERWDPATALVAGFAIDCESRAIQHALVVVSSTSGSRTFVDGVTVYYGAPGAVPIVVPATERLDTNDNGAFAVFRLPPGEELYLQTWGFPDQAAMDEGEAGLVLVGEQPLHAVANSVVNLEVWADQ